MVMNFQPFFNASGRHNNVVHGVKNSQTRVMTQDGRSFARWRGRETTAYSVSTKDNKTPVELFCVFRAEMAVTYDFSSLAI